MPKVFNSLAIMTTINGYKGKILAAIIVIVVAGGFMFGKRTELFERWSASVETSMFNKRNKSMVVSDKDLNDAVLMLAFKSEITGSVHLSELKDTTVIREFADLWNQSFQKEVNQTLIKSLRSSKTPEREWMIHLAGIRHRDWLENHQGLYACVRDIGGESFRKCGEDRVIWLADKEEFVSNVITFARKHLPEEEKKNIFIDWSATE